MTTTTKTKKAPAAQPAPPAPPFGFVPLPAITPPTQGLVAHAVSNDPDLRNLGILADLAGTWQGPGFNVIWRPNSGDPAQKHFLELNKTQEKIFFEPIRGDIPNRGLFQPDILMHGLTYLQQIVDVNANNAGLHIEPGIWATVPPTSAPLEPATVVRMGSIPHGTTIHAQGTGFTVPQPRIDDTNILPFLISDPTTVFHFPEQDLGTDSAFRSPPAQLANITQELVDNPNLALQNAIEGQNIVSTIVLSISTGPTPVLGGGTANTAFLEGETPAQANADAVLMSAIFWIETVQPHGGRPSFLQLQYTQTVMLDFGGLRWPHVTVATLKKTAPHQRGHFAGS